MLSEPLVCKVCHAKTDLVPAEIPQVRVNIRSLRDQRFRVWRCSACESLHTYETVDLDRYYQEYTFTNDTLDTVARLFLRGQKKHLTKAGVTRDCSILDYGCGNGKFVQYMRSEGFTQTFGYDAYAPKYRDRATLDRQYDVVFTQDVLEHAEDPWQMLAEFDRLVAPGGIIFIGTPNATAIDLKRPEEFLHALHVPYHRHIFSERALIDVGEKLDWDLVRFYPHSYHSTPIPFLNYQFAMFYMASWDNTVDSLVEPPKANLRLIFHPMSLFYGLFGAFFPAKSDCQIVFRARKTKSANKGANRESEAACTPS